MSLVRPCSDGVKLSRSEGVLAAGCVATKKDVLPEVILPSVLAFLGGVRESFACGLSTPIVLLLVVEVVSASFLFAKGLGFFTGRT